MDGNPFVGPDSVPAGRPLFGRHDEIETLLDLLLADRVVLLYSPSGAGKSSLINAGLRVELERRGFTVSPILRIGEAAPPEVKDANRYILSTLLSLEKHQEALDPGRLQQLARMSLVDGFQPNPFGEVLLFDQFEEVLTADPFDNPAKDEFFRQLGTLLRAKGRWAVLAMREDYLAGLDPFTRYVPTRLANTFRLKLLSAELPAEPDVLLRGAMEVVVNTAESKMKANGSPRVHFAREAAAELISNLRKVRQLQRDGTWREHEGDFVEPVQLQVVCRQLWEDLPSGTTAITVRDIRKSVNIDGALGRFFTSTLTQIAKGNPGLERDLINLFHQHLITKQGTRRQIRAEEVAHLPMAALVKAHIVRSETRLGTTYELAHDRMIDPVISECAKWEKSHLEQWQRDAEIWNEERTPGRLARGAAYNAMRRWIESNPGYGFRKYETDFYDQSRAAAVSAAWLKGLRIAATAVGLVAIAAAILSLNLWRSAVKARDEAEIARTKANAASVEAREQADLARENLSRMYAEKAQAAERDVADGGGAGSYRDAWIYTTAAMALSPKPQPAVLGKMLVEETLPGHAEPAEQIEAGLALQKRTSAAFLNGGADGMAWAYSPPLTQSCTAASVLGCWKCGNWQGIFTSEPLEGPELALHLSSMAAQGKDEIAVAVSASQESPAAPPCNNAKGIIEVVKSDASAPYNQWLVPSDVAVDALATDGRWIVAGTADGLLWMDSTSGLKNPSGYNPAIYRQSCAGRCAPVSALAFQPGREQRFAAARRDGKIEFFRIADQKLATSAEDPPIAAAGAQISAIAFWPESTYIATGHVNGTLAIWDLRSGSMVAQTQRHSSEVLAVAFDTTSGLLRSADREGYIQTSPLKPEIFGERWDLRSLFDLGTEGARWRSRLYRVSREKLGFEIASDLPVALPASDRKAVEYFNFGATEHFTPAELAKGKLLLRPRFINLPNFPAPNEKGDLVIIPDEVENVTAAVVSKKGITEGFTARFEYRIRRTLGRQSRFDDRLRFFFYRDGSRYQGRASLKDPVKGTRSGYELSFEGFSPNGVASSFLASPSGSVMTQVIASANDPSFRAVCVDVSPVRRLGACEAPGKATEFQGVRVFLGKSDIPALKLEGPLDTSNGSSLGFYATTSEAIAEHIVRAVTVTPAGSAKPDPAFDFPAYTNAYTAIREIPKSTGYPKFENGALVLTKDQEPFQASAALVELPYLKHYSVEFEYRMKNAVNSDSGHTGTGLAFLFAQHRWIYENSSAILPMGLGLGLRTGRGYGIVLTGLGERKIILADTDTTAYVAENNAPDGPSVYSDGAWRKVRVEVDRDNSKVRVWYEGKLALEKSGVSLETSRNAIGFTASTGSPNGGGGVAEHAVRNVVVRDLSTRGHTHPPH